jgi:organic hydroperoxide reductase OsmC/OhrA
MSTLKDFRFQVAVEGEADRIVSLKASGKPELFVATPPEFRGGVPNVWSPEDLLVAASATCYALTFKAIAERRGIPLRDLSVSGVGHVTRRADGRFGFVAIELAVTITTDEGFEDEAEKAARATEAACIVDRALTVPVEVELSVRTTIPPLQAIGVGAW